VPWQLVLLLELSRCLCEPQHRLVDMVCHYSVRCMADLKAAKGSNAEDGGDNWRQCVACTQHICFCVSDMLYFDGLLGDRADPLMQAWVALDNQVKSRLFAHSTHGVPEEIKLLQDKYMSLRVILFDYVASLNDQILFQDREGPKG